MLMIRACAPEPVRPAFRIPKRLARARKIAETKRIDNMREFHVALRKAGRQEQEIAREFFEKTQDIWDDLTETFDDNI
jgi:hypothetical protein